MTKREMVERTRKALAEFGALPPEEQFRQLIAGGVIDDKGEVLFGRDESRQRDQEGTQTATVPSPN